MRTRKSISTNFATAQASLSHLQPKFRPCTGRRGAGLGGDRALAGEEEEEDAGTARPQGRG